MVVKNEEKNIHRASGRGLERWLAVASFAAAAGLAYVAVLTRPEQDLTANILIAIAQFLTLAATILGIDYKFTSYRSL